ncbi:MAG: nucleoside hydrolase [Actinobacteria bacterium]|nr:nucleoside hydrolase [Actinomycetota bacterium]
MTRQAIVLDTDIGTDVDDALALAYALRHPGLDLVAVTTVSGDAGARAAIAARLLGIAGRSDVTVAAGASGFEDRVWFGHEGEGLAAGPDAPIDPHDAVTVLLDASHRPHPPAVVTVGMLSNLAAAHRRDPSYPQRVPRLTVMGGVFAPVHYLGTVFGAARDTNLVVDPDAALEVLDAGFSLRYVPLDVTVQVPLRREHLERLRAADELGAALAALVDVWAVLLHERSRGRIPDDVVAYLHDPLTVAAAAGDEFVTVERRPVTVAEHDGVPRTFVDPVAGREADVVTGVDADGFVEHWLSVVTATGA